MKLFLLAMAGGALGSGARYLVNVGVARTTASAFPWATLAVNVVGSFVMGLVSGWLIARGSDAPEARVFLATGILGGFTTFSAFSLDIANLIGRGAGGEAAAYVAGSIALALAGLYAGLTLAKATLS